MWPFASSAAFGVERDQADEHRFLSDRLLRRVGVCCQQRCGAFSISPGYTISIRGRFFVTLSVMQVFGLRSN